MKKISTRSVGGLASVALAAPAFAAPVTGPTALTMLLKFGESIPGLWNLAQAVTFVVAMFLFGLAMFKLKNISNRKSHEGSMSVVLTLVSATLMMYLSSSIDSLLVTAFGTNTIMQYTSSSILGAEGLKASQVVIGFVALIGLIAFARGCYALRMIGIGRGHHEDNAKRAIVLLVGGTFCLNIVSLAEILQRTLGIKDILI